MTWEWRGATGAGEITCRPLTAESFADIEAVFGDKGVTRRCFCMYWRRPDGGFGDDRDNRDRFYEVTRQGRPPGLVGYLAGEPVGWVQLGPRDDFPTIDRSRALARVDDRPVWSVNCFVTRVGYRRQGIGDAMLAAAIQYAASQGAELLEGYPFDAPTTSAVNLYTGTIGMFGGHDFVEVARRKPNRPVVRLAIGSLPTDSA